MAENTVFDSNKGSKESIKKILLHSSARNLTPTKIITDSRLARFKISINTSSSRLPAEDYVSLSLVDKVTSTKLSETVEKSRGILDTNQQLFLERVTKNIKLLEVTQPDLVKGIRSLNKDVDKVEISKLAGAVVPKPGSNITLVSMGKGLHIGVENPEQEESDEKTLKLNQDYLKDLLFNSKEKYTKIYPEVEPPSSYKTFIESHIGMGLPSQQEEAPVYKTFIESRIGMGLPSQQDEVSQQEEAHKTRGLRMPQEPLRKGVNTLMNSAKSLLKQGTNRASLAAKKLISSGAKKAAAMLAPLAAKAGVLLAGLGLLMGLVVSIIIWTIVYMVGFIFLVIIILFIINSGAYVVPPGGFTPVGENPYIRVTKTVDRPGPFDNSWADQPQTLNYTITVYALKDSLTGISFAYNCSVISKDSGKLCPVPQDIIAGGQPSASMPPSPPSMITATSPYVITYRTNLQGGGYYYDSLITDVFKVSALILEEQQSSSGSRSIRIGNPPDICPNGWPIEPEGGESYLGITQGPEGTWSHANAEAIDVGAHVGHTITARNSGIVHINAGDTTSYGCHVDIEATCNGEKYFSRYAHLNDIIVSEGQIINIGVEVGKSGGDPNNPPLGCGAGHTTGPHLHYEFRDSPEMGGGKIYLSDPPPYMEAGYDWGGIIFDFIPHEVPRGCSDPSVCGTIP